jgi:hypothetical protein
MTEHPAANFYLMRPETLLLILSIQFTKLLTVV